MDIEVCLGENVLDLVDPLFGFPVFEDGRGVSGRAQGHVDRTHNVKTIATTWDHVQVTTLFIDIGY